MNLTSSQSHEDDLPLYERTYQFLEEFSDERDDMKTYFQEAMANPEKKHAFMRLVSSDPN